MPDPSQPAEWAPNAVKSFGHMTHALGKYLPAKLSQANANARAIRAAAGMPAKKGKR